MWWNRSDDKMAMHKDFVKDFAERTKENYKIIKEYNGFDVTQLLNSAVALLIIPKEKEYNKILSNPQISNAIDKKIMTDIYSSISKTYYNVPPESLTLVEIVNHLRNGISHGHIEMLPKNAIEIEKINIKDKKGKEQFSITLSIQLLKNFFWKFSEAVAQYCK